jgi:hypothetical protein
VAVPISAPVPVPPNINQGEAGTPKARFILKVCFVNERE